MNENKPNPKAQPKTRPVLQSDTPAPPAKSKDNRLTIPQDAFVYQLQTSLDRAQPEIIRGLKKLKREKRLVPLASGFLPVDAYIILSNNGKADAIDREELERVLKLNLLEPRVIQYLSESRVKRG